MTELLARHPDWVGDIYAAVLGAVSAVGPLYEDAVDVGVFLKSDRTFAEFRPRVRSVLLWVLLPDERSGPRLQRVLRSGAKYAHGFVLTGSADVGDALCALLEEAYDFATD